MGTTDLSLTPVFLNGHLSVRSSGAGSHQRVAFVNLRRAGLKPHNTEAVRQLAIEFAERYPMGDFYGIDPETLKFQVVPGVLQSTLTARLLALDTPAADSIFDMEFASVSNERWMVKMVKLQASKLNPRPVSRLHLRACRFPEWNANLYHFRVMNWSTMWV